jgi:hypothetical protein
MSKLDDILTTTEAAAELRRSPHAIDRALREDPELGDCHRVGPCRVIRRADLPALLAALDRRAGRRKTKGQLWPIPTRSEA